MKITQVNNRYVVETEAGRLHILNRKSLVWNLKRVFNYDHTQVTCLMAELDRLGTIEVAV